MVVSLADSCSLLWVSFYLNFMHCFLETLGSVIELLDTLICMDKANSALAKAYSESLGLTLVPYEPAELPTQAAWIQVCSEITKKDSLLFLDPRGLHWQSLRPRPYRIHVDFASPQLDYRRQKGGGFGQLIAKAMALKPNRTPRVFDATAGLGTDAFVLASLGCRVHMAERNPVVRVLLADGLFRAKHPKETASDTEAAEALKAIVSRMELSFQDSRDFLQSEDFKEIELLYLDPMFPHREKTALVKKEMQALQYLVGSDADGADLLERALPALGSPDCSLVRVVVKRPRVAPHLSRVRPNHQYEGKRNRYDIYLHFKDSLL